MIFKYKKLLTIITALGIAVVAIALLNFFETVSKPFDVSNPPPYATPQYLLISDAIVKMSERKWDVPAYRRIKTMINVDEEISPKEKQELIAVLDSEYKLLLKDTIISYCKTTSSIRDIEHLEKEVSMFNDVEESESLSSLKESFNLSTRIDRYANEQQYNSNLTTSYRSKIDDYSNRKYLGENNYLIKILNQSNMNLDDQVKEDDEWKKCLMDSQKKCRCSIFDNTYYRKTCINEN